ncbi:MAG TPA: RNA 2',3'-cyclic phosphodiesterase [Candidatus Acidoferrales bacterium]|nr:RNA 2',3'-cyclic phosphodiesterase [Candidatus Acidoferrales bacterium]
MSVRLFVALDLRGEIRESIRDVIARLKPLSKSARWVRPEGMHVTLKFIGHVAEDRLDPIRSALAPVRSPRPVDLRFRGVGFFPNDERPRVIWCGVESSTNLPPLARAVERALEPLGIALETRDFVPHLTLARFSKPGQAPELAQAAAESHDREFGLASETEFHLFESILRPSGAEYRKLGTFPFVQGAE